MMCDFNAVRVNWHSTRNFCNVVDHHSGTLDVLPLTFKLASQLMLTIDIPPLRHHLLEEESGLRKKVHRGILVVFKIGIHFAFVRL